MPVPEVGMVWSFQAKTVLPPAWQLDGGEGRAHNHRRPTRLLEV